MGNPELMTEKGVPSPNMIFVGGAARSGMTLLRVIPDSRPNFACGPEFKIMSQMGISPGRPSRDGLFQLSTFSLRAASKLRPQAQEILRFAQSPEPAEKPSLLIRGF
jgi:hypothetical protein